MLHESQPYWRFRHFRYTVFSMENIVFKVPDGTKSKLRRINPNLSALLREQVHRLLETASAGSVHDRASRLCGVVKGGRRNVATGKDYLKQYAPKRSA
jgi:hypothetical protein